MTIQEQILYLKIKQALKGGPLSRADLLLKVRGHGNPIIEHDFDRSIQKFIFWKKIYFDEESSLFGLSPFFEKDTPFIIPDIFLETDVFISEHQEIFHKYQGAERLKHRDKILDLSEKINDGIKQCCILFVQLKDAEKNAIRDKVSSRLKSELYKYQLEHNENTIETTEKPIEKEEEIIEGKSEQDEHIDLSEYINAFTEDSEELLYPILYKGFPNRDFINEKLDQIIDNLIDTFETIGNQPCEKVLNELKPIFNQGLNTLQHDAFLYDLIYQHKEQFNKEFEDARAIALLKSQITDPFNHFFKLSNLNMEHLSFAEDSAEFDVIIREVCRDNIITVKERSYLAEKAKEYFIDTEKLNRYLNNPFLGFESFKIFVDQICEDGIVTETEKEYINEKAEQYNVPKELLKKMISTGLLRAQFTSQLAQDEDFYEIVFIYLFANAYGLKTVEQRLSSMLAIDANGHSITDQLETKKEVLFDFLCDAVNGKKELEALKIESAIDIHKVFARLSITTIPLGNILHKEKVNSASLVQLDNVTKQNEETFNLDGHTFAIHEISQEMGPLFWCKTEGLHQDIYINKSHPKYEFYSSDSFKQILIAVGRSSLSFSDSSGEIFYNRLKNYIELIN